MSFNSFTFIVEFHNSNMLFVFQFPFFCSDREYIFGRRIWESGKAYYCVTKVSGKNTFVDEKL